jgi:hypothetical protein
LQRLRERAAVLERVVTAGEVERVLGPLPVDDLELLREQLEPRVVRGELEPVRTVLELVPARPEASSTRPPEMWSTVAATRASSEGWRKVAGETMVPSRMRPVCAATPASVVQASSEPRSSAPKTEV